VWIGVIVALTGLAAGARTPAGPEVRVAAQAPTQGRGAVPSSLSWEWWNDADVQRELALSADKIKRINDLYARRNQDLRPIVHEYQKLGAELDKMTRERVVDEATYQLQVMRVESARSRLNETRLVMLYRFYRELTPDQHQKLQGIMAQRFNRGGRGRPAPDVR